MHNVYRIPIKFPFINLLARHVSLTLYSVFCPATGFVARIRKVIKDFLWNSFFQTSALSTVGQLTRAVPINSFPVELAAQITNALSEGRIA